MQSSAGQRILIMADLAGAENTRTDLKQPKKTDFDASKQIHKTYVHNLPIQTQTRPTILTYDRLLALGEIPYLLKSPGAESSVTIDEHARSYLMYVSDGSR